MKKAVLFLCFLLMAGSFFSSCKKDKSGDKPVVFLTPSDLYVYGNINDVISISISARCEDKMNRFYITAQPENGFLETIFDSSIAVKNFSYLFQYKVPSTVSGKSVVFSFNALADNGNVGTGLKRLVVQSDTSVIFSNEYKGNRMYANNPFVLATLDAYDLEAVAQQQSQSASVDSSFRDIQDNSGSDTVLKKVWISPAGGKFRRDNGFDYPNATAATVKNSYNSGGKVSIIDKIAVDDIIIVKLGSVTTDVYAVIKITSVHDDIGKDKDYYEFDIKKAP